MTEFEISLAKVEDTELLVSHRVGMWKEIRPELAEKTEELKDLTRNWIKTKLSDGKLMGFIAKTLRGRWLEADAFGSGKMRRDLSTRAWRHLT
jgi:hypothetical protein